MGKTCIAKYLLVPHYLKTNGRVRLSQGCASFLQ